LWVSSLFLGFRKNDILLQNWQKNKNKNSDIINFKYKIYAINYGNIRWTLVYIVYICMYVCMYVPCVRPLNIIFESDRRRYNFYGSKKEKKFMFGCCNWVVRMWSRKRQRGWGGGGDLFKHAFCPSQFGVGQILGFQTDGVSNQ
jgi:hypothetical protein